MIRKNMFEILMDSYDVKEEIAKISTIFNSDLIESLYLRKIGRSYRGKIEEFVDRYVIHDWKSRGTCLSCFDLKQKLGFKLPLDQYYMKDEDILNCLEYIINIDRLFLSYCDRDSTQMYNAYYMMKSNIGVLLDNLGYQKVNVPEKDCIILVPNCPEAVSVAEISSQNTALAIMKYHHASLTGNIEEKRKLLQQMALEYENLLKTPPKGVNEELYSKTRGLINQLNIRHNASDGKYADLIPENLEEWYDDIYQMILLCVLENDNLERMQKADSLLKSFKAAK